MYGRKLTADAVVAMREAASRGWPVLRLAHLHGVSETAARMIVRRRTYRRVKG